MQAFLIVDSANYYSRTKKKNKKKVVELCQHIRLLFVHNLFKKPVIHLLQYEGRTLLWLLMLIDLVINDADRPSYQ